MSKEAALTFTVGHVLEQHTQARLKLRRPGFQKVPIVSFVRDLLLTVPPELLIDSFDEHPDWQHTLDSARYNLDKILQQKKDSTRGPNRGKEIDPNEVSR